MATDDERREVARRLRSVGLDDIRYSDAICEVMMCTGLTCVGDEDCHGSDERPECVVRVFARLADLIEPEEITGDTSDGYHTFDELYDHRAKLFSVIVRDHRELAWKSMLHHDGTMYDGMFIVGVETPGGQATYHYDVNPYWDMFDCEVLDRAPEWDGHTPRQAIDRIAALGPSCDRDALLALADRMAMMPQCDLCPVTVSCTEHADGCAGALMGHYASSIREALGVVG